MKQIYKILPLLSLILLISSCNDDRDSYSGDNGKLLLNLSLSGSDVITKSVYGNDWNPTEDCTVEIFQAGKDEALHSLSYKDIPSEGITLDQGDYTLVLTAGDELDATFAKGYYYESEDFRIERGLPTNVQIACKMKNVLSTVQFTDELIAISQNISVTIYGKDVETTLVWDKDNSGKTGYFILPEGLDVLAWTFEGTVNGKELTLADIIEEVSPNVNYILTFSFDESQLNTPDGGVIFELKIKEAEPDDTEINFSEIGISGDGFIWGDPVKREYGVNDPVTVSITGAAITSVEVSVDALTQNAFGLSQSTFDFLQMEAIEIEAYAAAGIVFSSSVLTKSDALYCYNLGIEAGRVLPGEYEFEISVNYDNNDKEPIRKTLNISVVTQRIVGTNDLFTGDAWAKKATLRGSIFNETAENIFFEYRKVGEEDWTNVPATINGDNLSASISGLTDNTTYEYRVKVGEEEGEIKLFTTEEATQMPNSSFEDHHTTGGLTTGYHYTSWFYPKGGDMFWDSGNKGAASARKNVTTQSTDYVKKGSYSVKLDSQFAELLSLGRFAAGNIFTGEYKETLMTNLDDAGGRLLFGREFTSRPSKLRGWYKYTVGTIDFDVDYIPEDLVAEGAKIGEKDKAFIYFALSDKGGKYEIINTTAKNNTITLFDKNDSNIIAYGEFEETETTDLKQFEIDLDYRSLDRIPTHIIVVCSASKYGDYFTGSTQSTLWLDDFELIYE